MDKPRRFLLAIDDSEATERAAHYTGRVLAGRDDIEIHLLHVLPPLPPELLETGGGTDRESQARIEAEQEVEQKEWIAAAAHRVRPLFDSVRTILLAEGVPGSVVREHSSDAIPEDRIHQRILDAAAECSCATVILGRGPRSWRRELLNLYVTHDLVKSAQGFTVWVVE